MFIPGLLKRSFLLLCFLVLQNSYSQIPTISSTVPVDPANGTNASKQDLAAFAWQEFVALNWPARSNPSPGQGQSAYFRGQASAEGLGSTGPGGTLVWQTYTHRVELYPPNSPATLPDISAAPHYNYPGFITISKATPDTDLNLFNNLDEASEIGLANMYFKPFVNDLLDKMEATGMHRANAQQMADINADAIKSALLYEAKANPVIYNYVKSNGFQESSKRGAAAKQTVAKINNQPFTEGATFEFPSGAIEIKATWRRYDANRDDLNDYIWQDAIYYTGASPRFVANNARMLLIGLHIIHKTPSFPAFTFATFEHVSIEQDGFIFKNTHPQTAQATGVDRRLPDPGVIEAVRQFPIPGQGAPFDLQAFNASVQQQIRSQFPAAAFLANYRLIGIQAEVANDPGGSVPAQEFFLSNFATETNNALQFFQGSLSGTFANIPDPNQAQVRVLNPQNNRYEAYAAGGCIGCHGAQGQQGGFDFSVISAKGNFFIPEAVLPYPGGAPVMQNPTGFPLKKSN